MVSLQYGNSVMSQRIVCEWVERFKNGRTSVNHGEGTGRQSTSITDADMERVYVMILQNIQVTVDEVAHQLHRFTTDQQLDVTVHAWLISQHKTFYSEGIKQIVW